MTEQQVNKYETVPGLSIHSIKLIDAMKDGKPGDRINAERLAEISGRDCRPGGEGYGNLQTAKRRCERDHGVVWEWVREGACVVCLAANEIKTCVDRRRRHISRTSKRALRQGMIALGRNGELDAEKRKELTAQVSMLGAIQQFSRSDAPAIAQQYQLPATPKLADLLKQFGT